MSRILKIAFVPIFLGLCNTSLSAQQAITERSFGNVGFKLDRISTNETDYLKLPNAWAAAYGSDNYKNLKMDRQIAELVRLRVSQLDKCNYCEIFHSKAALDAQIPEAKIFALSSWKQSDLFTPKEKAALLYAEALSTLNQDDIQQAFDGLTASGFSNAEKEELTNCIILMDVWSRIFLAQGKISVLKK